MDWHFNGRNNRFNSTVVRLKASESKKTTAMTYMFQFHSGSIKSTQNNRNQGHNPRFQFHSGSIKSKMVLHINQQASSFNSTVVRLKAIKQATIYSSAKRFQFHSGSIKSEQYNAQRAEERAVSIPQWFD